MRTVYGGMLVVAVTAMQAVAATRYVSPAGSNVAPYTNWATAAQAIQSAVNACVPGDVVVVTNGIYTIGGAATPGYVLQNRVMITNRITVRSVNGPGSTFIYGEGPAGVGAARCVFLGTNATLSGFTLSNGFTRTASEGDAIYDRSGAGVLAFGGGVVTDCVIVRCTATASGGGAYLEDSQLLGTTVIKNTATNSGGGIRCQSASRVTECTVAGNATPGTGGGIHAGSRPLIERCTVHENTASTGGGIYGNVDVSVENTLIYRNRATSDAGGLYLNSDSMAVNVTVCENRAGRHGGGVILRGSSTNLNSVIFHNTAVMAGTNHYEELTGNYYAYCATTPDPGGVGNVTADPRCADVAAGDYRLGSSSPCIGAGNNSLATSETDLDGRQRILGSPAAIVDMGCYEVVPVDTGLSTNHYVSVDGGNVWPYSTMGTAARNIQDAIDAANPGDVIDANNYAYNGAYRGVEGARSRVVMTKDVTLTGHTPSADGYVILGAPDILTGGTGSNAIRGIYMTAGTLRSFTVSNGYTRRSALGASSVLQEAGGGVALSGGMLTNCIIEGNVACAGGGLFIHFAGGDAVDCVLQNNSAMEMGGGAAMLAGRIARGMVVGNDGGAGGGIYIMYQPTRKDVTGMSIVEESVVSNNQSWSTGAGVYLSKNCMARNCHVVYNATTDNGGGVYLEDGGDVRNCLVARNSAVYGGGAYVRNAGTIESCTVVSNTGVHGAGGVMCENGGTNLNTIVYHNRCILDTSHNVTNIGTSPRYLYSCTYPGLPAGIEGPGMVTNEPLFTGWTAGDFHLVEGSPCSDAGSNQSWMAAATDLDGNPRIYVTTVDMGCYELVPEPAVATIVLGCALVAAVRKKA